MNPTTRQEYHLNGIKTYQDTITNIEKTSKSFVIIRLGLFLLAVLGSVFLWEYSGLAVFALVNLIVILFVIVTLKEAKLTTKKRYSENYRAIHQHELKLLDRDFENLDQGKQYLEADHNYTNDLDVFGANSIYQLLNRTCTLSGRQLLAACLNRPPLDKKSITDRQLAIQELSSKEAWCYDFLAYGKESVDKKNTKSLLAHWIKQPPLLNSSFVNGIRIVFPILTIIITGLAAFGIVAWSFFWLAFLLQLLITGLLNSKINAIHGGLGKKFAIIGTYIKLVNLIEEQSFQSELLQQLQHTFVDKQRNVYVSASLHKLKSLLDRLDARLNIYVAVFLNGLFLWDINVAVKVERWRKDHKAEFETWLLSVGKFDVLISKALYALSNSDYIYPTIKEGSFTINGRGLGHPLIDKKTLVTNDYTIEGNAKVDLLTGANMAGKSTFLRTLGVNVILSRIGVPVCAEALELTPVKLFSSLRTVDSLKDNESFFYAELKRLQKLITLYKEKEDYFFLLDEILKGTNSKDQHKGSVGLIQHIISLGGHGIIATHDLALATLEDQHPKHIRNICFEIEIVNNELQFDYKLKPGFCKTMNASFLMTVMGII